MKSILLVTAFTFTVILFLRCTGSSERSRLTAQYAGTAKCQSCHQKEFDLFAGSDHFHAMDTASAASVLGNFNNSFFVHYGDTSFFYQRNNKYYVRTTDSSGIKKEFLISYTFGWRPLQQYLVQFDDGRMQVLPFCWDTRPREKGGQRWFHLYNKEKILPGDELFWMDYNQNWNYMCADCHTTNFKKNFDAAANTFRSKWSESRVSCESCHGPASGHLQWTEKKDADEVNKGFSISLAAKPISWKMDVQKGTTLPQEVMQHDTLTATCARCHARATRLTDEYTYGASFLQSHIPATINPAIYHIDGQIKDEDYEYGSFLQSKMYARGVTCISCHDPHSMKIKATGNTLCASCHSAEKFDGPQHTMHQATSTGSQCVNCHMPITTYMVVDDRRDHSIRIPRPDHSLVNGTPNACNKCHTDKTVQWAADNFNKWYAAKLPAGETYGELLYNVSKFVNESEPSLYRLLSSAQYPAIIKAAAMEQYPQLFSTRIIDQVRGYLQSTDPNLRLNAEKSINGLPAEIVLPVASPLLADAVLAVRMEAMLTLAAYYQQLQGNDKTVFEKVLTEYLQVQQGMSHRPEGYLNQGIALGLTGRTAEAEQAYLSGVLRFPRFVPFYMNLADAYRVQNQETKAREYIDRGLQISPGNADLHYALGLWYIRQKENVKGLAELKKAAELNPVNASVVYGYAIGLFSTGKPTDALRLLEKFLQQNGNNSTVLDGLVSICQDLKMLDKANGYLALRKNVFGY